MAPEDLNKYSQYQNYPSFVPGYAPPVPQGQQGQDKLLLDLQVYQDPKKANPLAGKQAQLPLQPLMLSSPFIPPQFTNYLSNFMKNFYTPFIYKDYNINIGGPAGDDQKASMIYEDILPAPEIFTSYKTLRERNNLVDYVRSTFISTGDGEFIEFDGSKNSLVARLKLLELAPFGTNPFNSNPYYNLPQDLHIYKSCYPIVLDKKDSSTKCQKNSVGMIVRIYKINKEELYSRLPQLFEEIVKDKTSTGPISFSQKPKPSTDFDVWREEIYYNFVRNSIDKSIVSPNFIQSYCYFLWSTAKLDYGKNGKLNPTDKDLVKISESGIHLILLCESPTMNLNTWSSNLYTIEKNVKTQIYSGFKPAQNWETVIFQMLSVFYLMDKMEFTFSEMSVKDNFYIKDVNVYGDSSTQFWIYRISGIDFYIPCKGDLLMLDHNYHDLKDKSKKKIIGKIFEDSLDIIKSTTRANAINCINVNQFNASNSQLVSPPESIMNLLTGINTDLTQTSSENTKLPYEELLLRHFAKFLHNRIGTMIRDTEKAYIKKNDIRPFVKGELVIYESKYDTYEIVLYLQNIDEYKCKCISRKKGPGDIYLSEIVELNKDMIYHYSESEIIRQDVIPGQPSYSLDGLIETYIM